MTTEKIMSMKLSYLLVAVILIFPFTYSVSSQEESHDAEMQAATEPIQQSFLSTDQEIRTILDTLREVHLVKELALPEDRTKRLLETMRNVRQIRQQYVFQQYQLENKLASLLELTPPRQEELQAVLKELETVKMEYYQRTIAADHKLRALLSPEEQAKYVLFQRNFNKKLQEMILNIRQQSIQPVPQQNFLLRKQDQESVIRQPR